ncbi:MAG: lipopolysaccharide transport periplasmic protein LptA [Endozoicomonadaceae bacterium]|nr:lipopolysaccharide transport periplasmic protein LptA [Endozoicomonadaceae bacterium]
MNPAKLFIPLLTTMALFNAMTVSALLSDRKKPIHISSDSADIDNKNGISIYRGNVIITQGTTKLTGDIITLYSQNHQIQKVVSQGGEKQAYFEEEQNAKSLLKAWGQTIKYHFDSDRIELIKQARLEQKNDIFTGDLIEYNQQNQIVNAKSENNRQGKRVEMIIQPHQRNNLQQSQPD